MPMFTWQAAFPHHVLGCLPLFPPKATLLSAPAITLLRRQSLTGTIASVSNVLSKKSERSFKPNLKNHRISSHPINLLLRHSPILKASGGNEAYCKINCCTHACVAVSISIFGFGMFPQSTQQSLDSPRSVDTLSSLRAWL